MFRRTLLVAMAAIYAALAMASPALAHIDPDPADAQAGSSLTVGFTVEHGCEGSPTVQLDMRLPDGVSDAKPVDIEGWAGSIDDNVITFSGGPLADDVEGTFAVTMTLPPTPDVTIFFPFVQRCEVGEIRWIGIPTDPGEELDEPAPAMLLTGPVATTTAPATTVAPSTTAATVDAAAPTTPAEVAPTTPTTETSSATTVDVTSSTDVAVVATPDEVGDPDTGTWFFAASIVAVLVIGAIVYFRSRSARAAQNSTEP